MLIEMFYLGESSMKVLGIIVLVLALLWAIWTFFFCCYGWMVLAFPSFEVFPRWAFVLLLCMFTAGSK